jgi:hypothetical protein
MKVQKTKNIVSEDGIVMAIYGLPKVGKTSFAASTSKVGNTLIMDFEKGTKYLGERGINCDVVVMKEWFSKNESKGMSAFVKDYQTIVVDPVGQAMDFIINGDSIKGEKYRQNDGTLTTSGWMEVKTKMGKFIQFLKSTGKDILLVFHAEVETFENQHYYSLMIATKLKTIIPGMVEIISYLSVVTKDGETKRILHTPAAGENYVSGDRTGRVPETIEISEMHGWEDFKKALRPKGFNEENESKDYTNSTMTEEEAAAIAELDKSEKKLDEAMNKKDIEV